jgi:anti-anti-sigma regulatory factor
MNALSDPARSRIIVFSPPGDVLSSNALDLRASVQALLDSEGADPDKWDLLEIDLRRARMVDSVGLNLLVQLLKVAGERGKNLRVRINSLSLQRMFRFTRLDRHAEIVFG